METVLGIVVNENVKLRTLFNTSGGGTYREDPSTPERCLAQGGKTLVRTGPAKGRRQEGGFGGGGHRLEGGFFEGGASGPRKNHERAEDLLMEEKYQLRKYHNSGSSGETVYLV